MSASLSRTRITSLHSSRATAIRSVSHAGSSSDRTGITTDTPLKKPDSPTAVYLALIPHPKGNARVYGPAPVVFGMIRRFCVLLT